MIRLAVSVEGKTEEDFVDKILANDPHLREVGVKPTPILIGIALRSGRGGSVSVEHLASDMAMLYSLCHYDAVTSLVDFYGFRGRKDAETVDQLEERIGRAIRGKLPGDFEPGRIIPYVQQYEFEGLLFSDVDAFDAIKASAESLQALRNVRGRFPTPEDINDRPATAPSKQIDEAMRKHGTRGYSKIRDGFLVADKTGLDVICQECPRFGEWIGRLKTLGGP